MKGGEDNNLEQLEDKTKNEEGSGTGEGNKVNVPLAIATTDDTFYNKHNSFFDNISCDALEKEAGLLFLKNFK